MEGAKIKRNSVFRKKHEELRAFNGGYKQAISKMKKCFGHVKFSILIKKNFGSRTLSGSEIVKYGFGSNKAKKLQVRIHKTNEQLK